MKSFDYIVGASAVSVVFTAYFTYFVGIPTTTSTLIIVGTLWPLFLMLLNLKGISEASGTNNLLVVLKILALLIFTLVRAYALLTSGNYSNYHPFFPRDFPG